MSVRRKAITFTMYPNQEKITHALTLILHNGSKKNVALTEFNISQILFLADRSHLNRYGRPITFDNYYATVFGPRPEMACNILKDIKSTVLSDKEYYPNMDILSPSDVSAIENAVSTVSLLSISQLRKLTYGDVSYIDAWEEDSKEAVFPMSYALFFDVPDLERARYLAFMSCLEKDM